MRIISKTQDYYDGAGIYSDEPVWVRKELETTTTKLNEYDVDKSTIDKMDEMLRHVPLPSSHRDNTLFAIVAFCGYPHVVYYKNRYLGRPQDVIAGATPSTMAEKWNKVTDDKDEHISLDKEEKTFWFRYNFNDKSLRQWYDRFTFDLSDIHRKLKTPIFLLSRELRKDNNLVINPNLKSYGFQCVISPWDAYQELERFIGNDMVDCPLDNFSMTDEMKRDSKGMDEWSFKQMGPKSRKRKK